MSPAWKECPPPLLSISSWLLTAEWELGVEFSEGNLSRDI